MEHTQEQTAKDCSQVMALGRSLEESGEREQAVGLYREWLLQQPNGQHSLMCWYEFGRLLYLQGHHVQAENAFRSALELQPHFLEAAVALGKALEAQGRLDEATRAWEAAAPSKQLQVELLNNIARVSEASHQTERAESALVESLRLDPTQSPVLTTLLQQRQKLCRWPVLSESLGVPIEVQQAHVGPLMSLALFDDPAVNHAAVKRFVEGKHYEDCCGQPLTQAGQIYPGHKKLRLGFLSADFRLHATSVFFLPLIEHLDRDRFEVVLLDMTSGEDPFPFARQHLLAHADQVLPLQHLSDQEAALAIKACEVDVLVDMAGLTAGARPGITARRPAPVQMSYIGFLGSCGVPNVDYILTTNDLFPHEFAHAFSERPLEIEGMYLSFTNDPQVDTGTRRVDCDLDEGAFVYCALLNSYKITPEMFAAWMDILRSVPDSLLWLVEENPTMRSNLEAQARSHGIDARRLRFSQRVHPAEYRTRLALADVFLDSSPYGNGATTRDVLSANLPIVTKPGSTMMSRLTAHMIKAVGLQELVVDDMQAYVSKAIELGHDRDQVADLRDRITNCRDTTPLFDTRLFAKRFGEAVIRGVDQMRTQTPATEPARRVEVYQIYYDEQTRKRVMPGFLPLDNSSNLRPDWFEFWVILRYLREHTLRENTYYGFFSPRFLEKTGLTSQAVLQAIENSGQDNDVYLFPSVWDQCCYFINPWEQGEAWHPGITSLTQQFLDSEQIPIRLDEIVTDSSCTIYCNYLVANKKFWAEWQDLAEKLFNFVENKSKQIGVDFGDTPYGSVSNPYPMKTFIQERLASLILATGDYRVTNLDQSGYAPIFERLFENTAETRRALQTCDLLKAQYRKTQDQSYLDMYKKIRQNISYTPPLG